MDSVSPPQTSDLSATLLSTSSAAAKQHKRTYQACEPCRNRKVKCDLGSVDAPSDPPCLRCRREKKECYFTETRRKRKAGDPGGPDLNDDEYVTRNRRSGLDVGEFDDEHKMGHVDAMGVYNEKPDLDAAPEHLPRPNTGTPRPAEIRGKSDGGEVRNETAAALFSRPINQPGDALRLLVDAASRTETLDRSRRVMFEGCTRGTSDRSKDADHTGSAIDPAIIRISNEDATQQDLELAAALQAWSRLRFVRAGWFTAREGMAYLEYFHEHLAPLTPIPLPNLKSLSSHVKLLDDEPMLTITLLTIAARYRKLPGPGGASRSIYIHQILWNYLQGMITRMFWGQEQFGGGFCGAGAGKTPEELDAQRRGLRSLGTVESLLLLSDWHPRSMHFPPGDDGGDILLPLPTELEEISTGHVNRSPYASWIEPALRSDRMSWSLVGAAYNLAVELGVFDSLIEKGRWIPGYPNRASFDPERADRDGRLLHIYVSQTCGRLGYPNMLPNQGNDMDLDFLKMNIEDEPRIEEDHLATSEAIQRAWAELAAIMCQVNATLFRSKQTTHELITSGEYKALVEAFWPRLREWLRRFEIIKVPPKARTILMMEYEYTRTYVNSLSLQAALEQYATTAIDTSSPGSTTANVPPLFSSKLVQISKQNAPYIAEVVDATRNVLRHLVDGLVHNGGLKHSPVRVNFRVLSAAMFLLKTFALGVKEHEVNVSLSLLNATVDALRKSVVDDVHLGLRIADLLARLIASIGTKFVRVPVPSRSGNQRRHRASLSSRPPTTTTTTITGSNHQRTSSNQSVTGNATIRTPYTANTSPDFQFTPPLVDPNDPNIMIMPPPDYVYSSSLYGSQLSPHNPPTHPQSNGYPTTNFANPSPPTHQLSSPTLSGLQQPQTQQNPLAYSPNQSYSPVSAKSGSAGGGGSYDWYAIDVNPLLSSVQSNPGGGSGSAFGNGTGAWGNIFGPEISGGLEMLGTLADGFGFEEGAAEVGLW